MTVTIVATGATVSLALKFSVTVMLTVFPSMTVAAVKVSTVFFETTTGATDGFGASVLADSSDLTASLGGSTDFGAAEEASTDEGITEDEGEASTDAGATEDDWETSPEAGATEGAAALAECRATAADAGVAQQVIAVLVTIEVTVSSSQLHLQHLSQLMMTITFSAIPPDIGATEGEGAGAEAVDDLEEETVDMEAGATGWTDEVEAGAEDDSTWVAEWVSSLRFLVQDFFVLDDWETAILSTAVAVAVAVAVWLTVS